MCPELPNEIAKLLSEETEAEQPVSESVVQKIGKDINALIDRASNREIFLTSGSFTVPEGVNRILIFGWGGGGGGGGNGESGGANQGGLGGGGSVPSSAFLNVTQLDIYTVTIAAGGAGGAGSQTVAGSNGSTGGNTTLSGPGGTLTFPGAIGGIGGSSTGTVENQIRGDYASGYFSLGGNKTSGAGQAGQSTVYASGGTSAGASAGSGGGAGYGAGGNGTNSAAGASAAANSGAGGGGGGGPSGINSGGAGGSGGLIIIW